MLELFRSPRRATVWFVEASLLSLLAIVAVGLTKGPADALDGEHLLSALFISTVAQASMYYHGLYATRPMRRAELVSSVARALLAAAGVLWILSLVVPHEPPAARAFFAALFAAGFVLPAWRTAWARIEASESWKRPALILGAGPLARACASLIETEPTGLALAGMLAVEGSSPPPGAALLGAPADVARIAKERGVSHVIVACDERRGAVPVEALLELELAGVTVEHGTTFHERVSGKVFVSALRPSDLLFTHALEASRVTRCAKRALDLVASALGLCLAAPILAAAAIAIKLDSKGPVLYTQIRAGEGGRAFTIKKLRSMRTDAEARGAAWAAEDDPRVTRVGRFLRRTRIDEIPQLWNVLAGEMSLVGPRPERPVFTTELEKQIPFFRQRLRVKPGVTGHAQVRCRYGASIEDAREKLAYDLFYIKSLSVWFDLSILIDTVKVVLLRIGSR